MPDLSLSDLHNPENVTSFLHVKGYLVEADANQGFQVYPGSLELWQKMEDGRLIRVHRWLNKSIIATYRNQSIAV